MIFQHEEYESEVAEYLCDYLDPLMLVYTSIAVVIFLKLNINFININSQNV